MLSFWEKNSFLKYDYVIIGSGILGLSAACTIKEKYPQAKVLVLEKGIFPTGASTKNAGFACFGSLTEILADFSRIGEEKTVELVNKRHEGIKLLRKRLGDSGIGIQNLGGYELIFDTHIDVINKIGFVNKRLYEIFNQNVFEVREEKINEFGFNGSKIKSLVYSSLESQLDTGLMMSSLINYSLSIGVRILNGCCAEEINDKGNVAEVCVSNFGDSEKIYFSSNKVIVCTNAFTQNLLRNCTITPGRGHVIITKPLKGLKFKGVFHFDEGFYYFRDFEERVMFGGGRNLNFKSEETTDFVLNEKILGDLETKLSELILYKQKFEIETFWCGIMGFNDSREPEIRKVSDNIIYALSCNGMGIALSSHVARDVLKFL